MAHPLRSVGLVGTLALSAACKDEAKPAPVAEALPAPGAAIRDDAQTAADGSATNPEAQRADTPKTTPRPPQPPADPRAAQPAPPLTDAGITPIAQVVVADLEGLLGKLRSMSVLADAQAMLDPNAARGLLAMSADPFGGFIMSMRLDAPIGCVLFDAPTPQLPQSVACSAGFDGGEDAVKTALGAALTTEPGHLGKVDVGGTPVWVDVSGDRVTFTSGSDLFGRARPYVDANLAARGAGLGTAIEVVLNGEPIERLQDELGGMASANPMDTIPKTGDPLIDGVIQMAGALQEDPADMEALETFAFALDVDGGLPVFDITAHVEPGSDTAKRYAQLAGHRLDPRDLATVPEAPIALLATSMGLRQITPGQRAQQAKVARAWAAAAGLDEAKTEAALAASMQRFVETAGDFSSLSLHARSHGSPGVTYVSSLAPGAKRRDEYVARMSGLRPADVFGTMAGTVEWTFTPAAHDLGGVPVDRLQVRLTKEAIARISDPKAKKVLETFDTLVVDRVEANGWVVVQVDVQADVGALGAALGRLTSPPTRPALPDAFLQRAPSVQVLAGVSAAGVASLAGEPTPYRGGVDDLWLYSNVTPTAVAARLTTSEDALAALAKLLE